MNIWPILRQHGWNDIQLWQYITDDHLNTMSLSKDDIKIFKKLQNNLKCNHKCYSHEEDNNTIPNGCNNDCDCASVCKCVKSRCSGTSTYFEDPPCDHYCLPCIQLLEKHGLIEFWPKMRQNGWNDIKLWLLITPQHLHQIEFKESDIIRFKLLQQELQDNNMYSHKNSSKTSKNSGITTDIDDDSNPGYPSSTSDSRRIRKIEMLVAVSMISMLMIQDVIL